MLSSNTCNHLTVCKQIRSGSFKNVNYKLFVYNAYILYMHKQVLTLNNLHGLICHKTKQTKATKLVFHSLFISVLANIISVFLNTLHIICIWSNKTLIYKFDKFSFFNLSEKVVEKQKLQSFFCARKENIRA